MPSKNLWGDFGSAEAIRTPTTVLNEQASALNVATKGVLRGKIEVESVRGEFQIVLSIVAPAINNYEFEVLQVSHGIELYPATVVAAWERHSADTGEVECENEDEFTRALARILGSDRVRRVISSLIAQSRSK